MQGERDLTYCLCITSEASTFKKTKHCLLYYTRGPFEVVSAVLFHHIPKLYGSITAPCSLRRTKKHSLNTTDLTETCGPTDTTNPDAADLWPGGWRWSQRSYWPRAQCEWPSRCACIELASSPTASAAVLCSQLPATGVEHTGEMTLRKGSSTAT